MLLKPSTIPAEISLRARNQFKISGRWRRSIRATFFIGSMRERMTWTHHSSRKAPAQSSERYCQKSSNHSRNSLARTARRFLQNNERDRNPQNHWSATHRFCGGGEEAIGLRDKPSAVTDIPVSAYSIDVDPAPAVYAALDALGIQYERHEAPPVFTAGEAVSFYWRRPDPRAVRVCS